MGLRQDESSRINEQVDKILDITKRRGNPSNLAEDLNNREVNPEGQGSGSIAEQEGKGSNVVQGPWANRVGSVDKLQKNKGRLNFLKKKGPLAFIGTTVIAGGFGLVTFFSPGILLVHVKETLTQAFNAQFPSLHIRSNKMLSSKFTSDGCNSGIKIVCKFSSFSDAQIASLEKNGITIEKAGTTVDGQTRVKSITYNGEKIEARMVLDKISTETNLKSAFRKAYWAKYVGNADSIWKKSANFMKISKVGQSFEGDTFDEKLKSMESDIKEKTSVKHAEHVDIGDEKPDSSTGEKYTSQTEVDAANAKIDTMNEMLDEVGDGSTASKIMGGAKEVAGLVKITGVVDDVCTVYRTALATAYAAKTVRSLQLAYYAMIFLKAADQIKAGHAKADDISFLGKILTDMSVDDDDNYKSATDSFGYKYAAYGDIGKMTTSAQQYMSAGGLSASLTKYLEKNKKAKTICTILGNPIVGFLSLAAGAALSFFTAGESTLALTAAKASLKAALKTPGFWGEVAKGVGFTFAELFLPNLLKDMVAGKLVDEFTIGANAGDALTSGSSGMMATTAKFGGNAPLKPAHAVNYAKLNKKVAAEYAKEEQVALSPFDATSNYTFMGRIVDRFLPYVSKMSSLTGIFNSISSVTTGSLAYAISPNANAEAEPTEEEFMMCEDNEYQELGVATDPFCNVRYGITEDVLDDSEPVEVAKYLLNLQISTKDGETPMPLIDADGKPINQYVGFINNCIDRTIPLIKSDYDNGDKIGRENGGASECIFNESHSIYPVDIDTCDSPKPNPGLGKVYLTEWVDEGAGKTVCDPETGDMSDIYHFQYLGNAYLYLYYIDKRVNDGMDGI